MGMRYHIKADKHTSCEGRFPDELSFFFEQIGGYGEKSEVAQVAEVLNINLSAFQQYDHGTEDVDNSLQLWKEIGPFTELVINFLARLEASPGYYTQVKHNAQLKQQNEQLFTMGFSDNNKFLELIEEFESQPDYGYPSDYGYLSSGRILKDLRDLKNLLQCFRKNGASKIKLYYM